MTGSISGQDEAKLLGLSLGPLTQEKKLPNVAPS